MSDDLPAVPAAPRKLSELVNLPKPAAPKAPKPARVTRLGQPTRSMGPLKNLGAFAHPPRKAR